MSNPTISQPPRSTAPLHNSLHFINTSLPPASTIHGSQPFGSAYQYISGSGGIPLKCNKIPGSNMGHYVTNAHNQQPDLMKEIQDMKDLIKILKDGTNKRPYTFEEICPCLYDPSILVAPYPLGFEMPKFEKYKGKGALEIMFVIFTLFAKRSPIVMSTLENFSLKSLVGIPSLGSLPYPMAPSSPSQT